MKNYRKYRTVAERLAAFQAICDGEGSCSDCPINCGGEDTCKEECLLIWLEKDDSEIYSPEPCPFCGGRCLVTSQCGEYWVTCDTEGCAYNGCSSGSRSQAVDRHNRLARAAGNAAMERQA